MLFRAVYEGEETQTPPPAPPAPPPGKAFTQDDVNKFLAEDRRKHQEKMSKLGEELEKLKSSKNLTEEEKAGLTQRIEDLNSSLLSKEEEMKKTLDRTEKDYKKKVETEQGRADRNWNLYSEEVINSRILKSAADLKAVSSDQILDMLKPRTRLVEAVDDSGKPTGKYLAKIKTQGQDEKGNAVELDLEVNDFIKRMKEQPEKYGNLFLSEMQPGLGQINRGGSRPGDSAPPTDPVAYQQWRKQSGFDKQTRGGY
jgi:chromosome segregation ATPase